MRDLARPICGIALLAAAAYHARWRWPRRRKSNLQGEVWRGAEQRHKELQKDALDSRRNGYLDPTFLPLWGPEGTYLEGSGPEKVVHGWVGLELVSEEDADDWSTENEEPLSPEREDLTNLWRDDFEKLSRDFLILLKRPSFVPPGEMWARHWTPSTTINFCPLGQGLFKLAALQIAERKFKSAVENICASIKFASKLRTCGGFLEPLLGRSLQSQNFDVFVKTCSPSTDFGDHWDALSRTFLEAIPTENALATWLDDAVVYHRIALRSRTPGDDGPLDIESLVGLRSRRDRLFCNAMADALLEAREGRRPARSVLRAADVEMPNFLGQYTLDTMFQLSYLNRLQMKSLFAVTSLLAHRHIHGEFPAYLSDLRASSGLSGWSWEHREATLTIPFERGNMTPGFTQKQMVRADWLQLENRAWRFFLGTP